MGECAGNSFGNPSDKSLAYRMQAHWDAVSSGPLKEIIDKVKEIADLWLVHATLKSHDV